MGEMRSRKLYGLLYRGAYVPYTTRGYRFCAVLRAHDFFQGFLSPTLSFGSYENSILDCVVVLQKAFGKLHKKHFLECLLYRQDVDRTRAFDTLLNRRFCVSCAVRKVVRIPRIFFQSCRTRPWQYGRWVSPTKQPQAWRGTKARIIFTASLGCSLCPSMMRRTTSATVTPSVLARSLSHLSCGLVSAMERLIVFIGVLLAPLVVPVKRLA